MPRPSDETYGERQAAACINGQWHNATSLTVGFLEYTLDASTLYRKRCEINSFLEYLEKGIFSFVDRKVPCADIFEWMSVHLEENPLVKGSATNKLVAVTRALVLADLVAPDPLFALRYDTMKKLVLSLAKNLQVSKAKALCLPNPLQMLPHHTHRLLVTWMMTGVRFISLPEINRSFSLDPTLPFQAASTHIWQKTVVPSAPFVICVCDDPTLRHACPIHNAPVQWSCDLSVQANTILRSLLITRHSFRRTLALAFKLHSKYINNPRIRRTYINFLYKVFGWRPPRRGQYDDKCMYKYYTSDSDNFVGRTFPALALRMVAFYDDIIPVTSGIPMDDTHRAIFRTWYTRNNTAQTTQNNQPRNNGRMRAEKRATATRKECGTTGAA